MTKKAGLLLLILGQAIAAWPLGANQINLVQGERGLWEVRWHGSSIASLKDLPAPCPLVSRALNAAQKHELLEFAACFGDFDTNNLPNQVKSLFDDWSFSARSYSQLLVEVAVLDAQTPTSRVAAVSFVGAAPLLPSGQISGVPAANVQVVFARPSGDKWELSWECIDGKLDQYLRANAAPFAYRPNAHNEQAANQARLTGQAQTLLRMRELGESPENVMLAREVFRLGNEAISTNSWNEWQRIYRAEILNPPVVFDLTDQYSPDFTTPLNALRSYWRAIYTGDAQTLLNNSDERAREWLKKSMGVDPRVTRASYALLTNLTRLTVLLKASNSVEGNDYVLFLSRKQSSVSPKTNYVTFNIEIFRREQDRYVFTRDLCFSPFGLVLSAAGASGGNLRAYPEFHEALKRSAFPAHFYTIE